MKLSKTFRFVFVACFCLAPVLYAVIDDSAPKSPASSLFVQNVENKTSSIMSGGRVIIDVELPALHEFTEGVILEYMVWLQSGFEKQELIKGGLQNPVRELPLVIKIPSNLTGEAVLGAELKIPYCSTKLPKMCKFKLVKFKQPLTVLNGNGERELRIALRVQ